MGHFFEVRGQRRRESNVFLWRDHHGIEIDASEQILANLIFELLAIRALRIDSLTS